MKLVVGEERYDDASGEWFEEGELELLWDPDLAAKILRSRRDRPFSKAQAFTLCATVILDDLGGQVLEALLDVCPPLEDFLGVSRVDYPVPDFWGELGLVELCAYLGREELLDILLRRGGNVNVRPGPEAFPLSPLEAAAWGGSLACVERLLCEKALDLTFSVHLQRLWAKLQQPGLEKRTEAQKRCLERVAPLVAGMDFQETGPIPQTLHPAMAAEMGNDALFVRLCRQRGLTPKEAHGALEMLWIKAALEGRQDLPEMLLALLECFPAALELEKGQELLARSVAAFPKDIRLKAWKSRLCPGSVTAQGG